jgi:anti-sigma factor RsiW
MATPEQLALIHAELDGELDAGQRAELARSLLADPQLRRVREELRRVCSALDTAVEVEPPRELQASILAALPHAPARQPRWLTPWRYAACLAGVAVAAAITFGTLRGLRPATGELTGTIAPAAAALIDSTAVTGEGVSGRANLYRDASGLSLELALRADAALEVRITSGGYRLQINNLKNQDHTGGTPIRLRLPGLEPGAGRVELTFLTAGRAVGSASLRAGEK